MESDLIHPARELLTQRWAVSGVPAAATPIPNGIVRSGWVRLLAMGADVDYKVGPSTMTTVVKDATGSGATVGYTIPAGGSEDVFLTGDDTHITMVGSAAGFLVMRKAGQKKTSLP